MLVKDLDLQWPPRIEKLLSGITFISSVTGDIFQLDCFFRGVSEESLELSKFLIGIIVMTLIPILIGVISIFFWKVVSIFRQSIRQTYMRNAISMLIIFVFLIYPMMVNLTFEMFNCIKIEDQYFLKRDLDV